MESFISVRLDYYHILKIYGYTHGLVLPLHVSIKNEYSYTNFIEGNQWFDYTAGLIFGYKINKSLGVFLEENTINTGIEIG